MNDATVLGRGTHGLVQRVVHEGEIVAAKIYREFPLIPPEAMNEILVYKTAVDYTVPFRGLSRRGKKEIIYMDICPYNLRGLMDNTTYDERVKWVNSQWVYLNNDLRRLHSLGWTHGDISPLNILIERKGRPRFCDFGLSSPPINGARYGGSIGFKAPPSNHNHMYSDWWSLGATLYYFLTGSFFFHGVSNLGILPKHVQKWLHTIPLMRCDVIKLNLPQEILGPLEVSADDMVHIIAHIKMVNEGLSIEVSRLAADMLRRYSSYKELTLIHYPVALEIASKFISRRSLVTDDEGDYEEFRLVELDILSVLNYQLLTSSFTI